jgi:hypothetical protein
MGARHQDLLTDRQAQCDFDFNNSSSVFSKFSVGDSHGKFVVEEVLEEDL